MSIIPIDEAVHELNLGRSFDAQSDVAFHTIRYDFKPASVDTSKEARVDVGEGNQITVTVPHVEGSGISHTVFKGNKQPVVKECVLIIDHKTGVCTLEKISSKITVKKARLDGSSKAAQHVSGRMTPVEKKQASNPASSSSQKKSKKKAPETEAPSVNNNNIKTLEEADDVLIGEITDSSDEEELKKEKDVQMKERSSSNQLNSASLSKKFDVLDADLALSEDSDSS